MVTDNNFYKGKRVFVTGHTGFKGTWLCHILTMAEAEVTGYSLGAPSEPSMFELSGIEKDINSVIGDIRDFERLKKAFDAAKPEIVIHLAAQPLVLKSYREPRYTYETNVMGTVNILECVRQSGGVKSFLNVTTDKVYCNNGLERGYREDDILDGYDPYSNSKSCSELITNSYRSSFFSDGSAALSTARAGNVIGGGDFADDRIIPDCVRAAVTGKEINVRNPDSVRLYQHILDPLFAYLMILRRQYEDGSLSGAYNVGSDERGCIRTGDLVSLFCDKWGGVSWRSKAEKDAPYEADILKLDCSKIKSVFGWKPVWGITEAVEKTVEWTKAYCSGADMGKITKEQINEFLQET